MWTNQGCHTFCAFTGHCFLCGVHIWRKGIGQKISLQGTHAHTNTHNFIFTYNKNTSVSTALLRLAYSHIPSHNWGINYIVNEIFFSQLVTLKCLLSSAVVSRQFPHRYQFVAAKILFRRWKQMTNHSATNSRYNHYQCTFFNYDLTCHVNLFSDWPSLCTDAISTSDWRSRTTCGNKC